MGFLQRSGWESIVVALPAVVYRLQGQVFEGVLQQEGPNSSRWVPFYSTQKPSFQCARSLESMPQRDQELCLFLSSLKVVFDTTTLISQEFSQRD